MSHDMANVLLAPPEESSCDDNDVDGGRTADACELFGEVVAKL